MPNIPGHPTKNAEGAQGMTANGPSNKFQFQSDPGSPLANDGRYDHPDATDVGEGALVDRPGFGDTKLQNHALPHPLA